MLKRTDEGEDYRWNTDRLVNADDFNTINSVAIFAGPLLEMYHALTKEELKVLLDRGEDIIVLDVRDTEDFERGHIRGALNIPVSSIEMEARKAIGPDDLVIVYGTDSRCTLSAVAADKLTTIGLKNVMRYAGGFEEWRKTGETDKGTEPTLPEAA